MVPNLESLTLEGCNRIIDVHPSIGVLKKLKLLNLRGCKCLRSLPPKIGMKSLEELILSDCSNLERFPEIDGEMECFLKLYLDGTRIKELPSSIGLLRNLDLLNLKGCSNLVTLPSSINGCKCLRTLNLSGCSKLETLPENLQQVEFLEELDLSETAIRKPPSFIFQYKNLKVLSFSGCKGSPSKLRTNLHFLFKVMQSGSMDSLALMLPPLSGLSSLKMLNLSDCNLLEGAIPSDICCLSSLETLILSGNNFMSLPATLTLLSKLRFLDLSNCKRLKSLSDLVTRIESLNVDGCDSLEEVIANPSTISNSFYQLIITSISCFRLAENNNALKMLKEYIKVFSNARGFLDITIAGSEIPKWFSHQRECDGSSIKIPLLPNIQNDSQWMGVAFCYTFVSTFNDVDAWRNKEKIIGWKIDIHGRDSQKVIRGATLLGRKYRQEIAIKDDYAWMQLEDMCEAVIHDSNSSQVNSSDYELGRKYRQQIVRNDHLWIRFLPRDLLYPSYLGDKWSETKCD